MGAAFDEVCKSLRHFSRDLEGREIVAKCIIEVAKNGERDPAQIYGKATRAFSIGYMPVPIAGGDRDFPVPVYASIARKA